MLLSGSSMTRPRPLWCISFLPRMPWTARSLKAAAIVKLVMASILACARVGRRPRLQSRAMAASSPRCLAAPLARLPLRPPASSVHAVIVDPASPIVLPHPAGAPPACWSFLARAAPLQLLLPYIKQGGDTPLTQRLARPLTHRHTCGMTQPAQPAAARWPICILSTGRLSGPLLSEEAVANKLKDITPAQYNPRGMRRVRPYSIENSANEGFTGLVSFIPAGKHAPADVASDNECHDESDREEDFVEDSEDEGDEKESEPGDEAESSSLEEVLPEHRRKVRQDPGVRGGNTGGPGTAKSSAIIPPTRTSKHGRAELALSPEKSTKQPKITSSKPRKGVLPKTKMNVQVDSAADTSISSLEKDKGKVDATSSKEPCEVIEIDVDDRVDPSNLTTNVDVVMRESRLFKHQHQLAGPLREPDEHSECL